MIIIYTLATVLILLLISSYLHKRVGRRHPLIGGHGTVASELAPEGIVLIEGEAFVARAEGGSIPTGSQIVVMRTQSATLIVRKTT